MRKVGGRRLLIYVARDNGWQEHSCVLEPAYLSVWSDAEQVLQAERKLKERDENKVRSV